MPLMLMVMPVHLLSTSSMHPYQLLPARSSNADADNIPESLCYMVSRFLLSSEPLRVFIARL